MATGRRQPYQGVQAWAQGEWYKTPLEQTWTLYSLAKPSGPNRHPFLSRNTFHESPIVSHCFFRCHSTIYRPVPSHAPHGFCSSFLGGSKRESKKTRSRNEKVSWILSLKVFRHLTHRLPGLTTAWRHSILGFVSCLQVLPRLDCQNIQHRPFETLGGETLSVCTVIGVKISRFLELRFV